MTNERETRYADALAAQGESESLMWGALDLTPECYRVLGRAVMAVADAEIAAQVEAAVSVVRAEAERLRYAAMLACSALDEHPDHADTCEHSLNPEDECTCWRREVYAASVETHLIAPSHAEGTGEADRSACICLRDPEGELVSIAVDCPADPTTTPAPLSSGEAGCDNTAHVCSCGTSDHFHSGDCNIWLNDASALASSGEAGER